MDYLGWKIHRSGLFWYAAADEHETEDFALLSRLLKSLDSIGPPPKSRHESYFAGAPA